MKLRVLQLTSLVCLVALSLFAPQVIAQPTYCSATYYQGCSFGDYIDDFILPGELSTSINDPATGCTSTPGLTYTCYRDMSASMSVTLYQGGSYSLSTNRGAVLGPTGTDYIQIWIDFNDDGTFDPVTETVGGGLDNSTTTTIITITIPAGATLGTHRLRAAICPTEVYPNINPCPSFTLFPSPTGENWGEVHDYDVLIQAGSVSTCATPTLTLGATTCSSQIINWTAVTSATGYEWVVNTSSGAPSGSGTATTSLTFTASGLSSSTVYYAHVRTNCGGGSFSSWATITFTTAAGPAAITGTATVCPGGTTALSDATAGGVWSISGSTVAIISGSVLVHGGTPGTTTISYTVAGCASVITVTVAPMPAITGTTSLCPGTTTQLSDATPGGTWSSGTPSVATISATGLVYGTTNGTTVITYSAGGCSTNVTVTVGTLPPITGYTNICPTSTTQLSDATPGGTWSSSAPSTASVSGTGLVTGGTIGTAVITYSASGCSATTTVTVASLPAITGGNTVCVGSTLLLSDATGGGTWSSSNTSIATVVPATGLVSGVAVGGATITYSLSGCSVTKAITVGASIPPITGTTTFCVTGSTNLSDATAGGVWSSGNTAVATVSGTVVVHGVTAGTVTISYTLGGCSATTIVTVDQMGSYPITGRDTVCIGTPHALSDAGSGGVWSSTNSSVATVDPATGVVTGVTAGIDTIKYMVMNTCGTFTAKVAIHVFTAATCPTGINPVTEGPLTELKVFPNPNGGIFTMNLSSGIDEAVHVVITNIVGEKVREFTTTTNNMVDIKLNPPPGLYLLSASTAHGRYVAKVVVEK
ncbi:MAG: Ig-like domain-containing protein [Chitinophagales bacterium]